MAEDRLCGFSSLAHHRYGRELRFDVRRNDHAPAGARVVAVQVVAFCAG